MLENADGEKLVFDEGKAGGTPMLQKGPSQPCHHDWSGSMVGGMRYAMMIETYLKQNAVDPATAEANSNDTHQGKPQPAGRGRRNSALLALEAVAKLRPSAQLQMQASKNPAGLHHCLVEAPKPPTLQRLPTFGPHVAVCKEKKYHGGQPWYCCL